MGPSHWRLGLLYSNVSLLFLCGTGFSIAPRMAKHKRSLRKQRVDLITSGLVKKRSTNNGEDKYKYTNTNTQMQIHKYKYTNTNTHLQIHKYKDTIANTKIKRSLRKQRVDLIASGFVKARSTNVHQLPLSFPSLLLLLLYNKYKYTNTDLQIQNAIAKTKGLI